MNKEFIPYEQALELKELGFDEPCFGWFTNSYLRIGGVVENKHVQGEDEILAPLYQQAFRWFREKHGYYGLYMMGDDWNNFEFIIWRNDTMTKRFVISPNWVYETYEEAELACLNELIKIVKNK